MSSPARPFRRTSAGDFFDATTGGVKPIIKVLGIRLVPAAAAATAQVTDADGLVLADLSAGANGPSDEVNIPIAAAGKVTLATLVGAGAAVTVYLE